MKQTVELRHKLGSITALIVDMDGVLWQGDRPLPGMRAFFALLEERRLAFTLVTNNSSRPPEEYADRLARMGVPVEPAAILSSAVAVAEYLAGNVPPGARVYVIGEEGLRRAVSSRGFLLTEDGAEYVVAGLDRAFSYDRLKTATLAIRGGAKFIGSNPDRTFPTPEGLVPGAGAILAALEAASGVSPLVVGKPEPVLFQLAMQRMGARPETTAVIGDRLETDILGGWRAGLTTILLLSGVTDEPDLRASSLQPDLVFPHLQALVEAWGNVKRKT